MVVVFRYLFRNWKGMLEWKLTQKTRDQQGSQHAAVCQIPNNEQLKYGSECETSIVMSPQKGSSH